MRVLIGNTVKTEFGDYPCATREEAETLYMTLREREQRRESEAGDKAREPATGGARRRADRS